MVSVQSNCAATFFAARMSSYVNKARPKSDLAALATGVQNVWRCDDFGISIPISIFNLPMMRTADFKRLSRAGV